MSRTLPYNDNLVLRSLPERAASPMKIVGLLGGVASGKSLVARQFAALGAGVLDADQAGHEVLRMPETRAAIETRWGDEVLNPQGDVDRVRLARIVFDESSQGASARKHLEELTHPAIGRLLARQAAELKAAGRPLAVLDAPLLVEAGWDRICDVLVFVDAPTDLRRRRARQRGWTDQQFGARERAQESLDFKRERADFVLDNSGSPETTAAQVKRLWQAFVA